MADQTVFVTSDVTIDSGLSNDGGLVLFLKPSAPNESNFCMRFDVSTLTGKMWDSVVLKLTYSTSWTSPTSGPFYLSRIRKAIVYSEATGAEYSTGNDWDTHGTLPGVRFAEGSGDNDFTTRVDQFGQYVSGSNPSGTVFTSTDITDLVKQGVLQGGTLDILFYATSAAGGGTVHQYHSDDSAGAQTQHPTLFFTNVETMEETTTPPTGTASNVAVPSASVLSKSGRPPIAGADRQVTASILHDGVEPMTILSLTLKGEFGTDN